MIRIKRLFSSFHYAFKGLFKTIKEEQNLQIQIFFLLIVIILGFLFNITKIEWCVLLIVSSLVILMEITNSATERVTDVLKPRINSYVKEIKDIMAAAVMISSILAVVVGIIIFWPYFIKIL